MSTPLSKSANQFAVDLFQCYLRRHGDKYKNLLLCPYVIYHSLAMMLVGAKGNTAQQLVKLLKIPKSMSSLLAQASSSSSSSSSSGKNGVYRTKLSRPTSVSSNESATSIGSSNTVSSQSSLATPNISPRRRSKSKRNSPISYNAQETTERSSSRKSRIDSAGLRSIRRDQFSKTQQSGSELADEVRHKEFLLLTEQLIHGNHDFVHLASFIYLDKGAKRTEMYKAILRDYYETKPKKIDFDNFDLMVKTINEDVARTTENIYHDILSKQEALKLEKSYMLLVNAVFFRGFWLSNFTDVKEAPFNKCLVRDNLSEQQKMSQHNVKMMSKLDYLPVVTDEQLDARIITMPFEASDLQMLLVLPNNLQSDSTYLCERISSAKINQIMEEFAKTKCKTVRVSMPVFCIDSGKISIQSTLVTMGASDLFDKTKANLSGVCENKQVWLNKILHRCFIICDNRGSITSSGFEKARKRQANLGTSIASGRSGVHEFVADHPFMYIIVDSVTKTILLIGLYTDPSETLEVIHENQLSHEEAHQIYTEGVYKT